MLKLNKKNKAEARTSKKNQPVNTPQGITAKGNALKSLGVLALLVAVIPVAVGFIYLILLRDPGLQREQIDRVASSFAAQQATNIHRLLTRLTDRIHSAASSPLALSAIASRSSEDISLVEQAMLDYFPEVISLKIIAIDEMGTAVIEGGDRGLRNHIEVDLVRRASHGEKTHAEAYKFENRWLTSMTALVTHPRIADRKAVIIITLDNEQIGRQLKSLESAAGKFALEQEFASASGGPRVNVIAFSGSGDATEYTRRADIPDTPWRVAFTPSRALLDTLAIKPLPLFGVLAVSVAAVLCAIGLMLTLFPRRLESEINRVISAADRKTPLELPIPELVGIAKQLRRATLRALRQSSAPAPSQLPVAEVQEDFEGTGAPAELTNPMFQSTSILDEDDEVLDLDLDLGLGLNAEDALADASDRESDLPDHIFRAYDIRGHADGELSDKMISEIGRAIGSVAGEMGEQTLVVGCDGRVSSPP